MPTTITIESPQEFIQRHGKRVPIDGGATLLFESGAKMDSWGRNRQEPPDNLHDRLLAQRDYYRRCLKRDREEFERGKQSLAMVLAEAQKYDNLSLPDESQIEGIKAVKSKIKETEQKLHDIEVALRGTPEGIKKQAEKRRREEDAAARQAKIQRLAEKLQNISLD